VVTDRQIEAAYRIAQDRYAQLGVDTDQVLKRLAKVAISLHCWQGDDVAGLEGRAGQLGGGLAVTGNYPGRARNGDELRQDLQFAYSLIPGRHRLNLHAFYAETDGTVDRDAIGPEHYSNWIFWAKDNGLGMDFNPTFFSHPKAADGMTLAHPDKAIRRFWIEHGIRCRRIGQYIGKTLGQTCITNVWIPDGMKDMPVDRVGPRQRLLESLDAIFQEQLDPYFNLDAVESKLFGIGSESYVVGSHEFYLGYAASRSKILTLDMGHFHPTESVSDKLSAVLMWVPAVLLHVSRPVRWDSDHVVAINDDLLAVTHELIRGELLDRVYIALDYFDATINRIAAWVIGARNTLKALLLAMLEPTEQLKQMELDGNYTERLAMVEELKTMPFGAVWDYHCLTEQAPLDHQWISKVRDYEERVLSRRS
jgi:L-rhamnose isomerase